MKLQIEQQGKMKIALITIHWCNNYGAVLQTFATQKILSQYGEVEIINYFNPRFQYEFDLIRFNLSIQGIKMMIHDILRLKDRNKGIKKFKNFIESNIKLSKLLTQHDIQTGATNDFDVYVCGSDQIWNPSIISKDGELDPIYFLSFAKKPAKKISYASSMGQHYRLTDFEKAKVKDLLKDFTTISVRESDAQEMLSQLLERKVFHVLDPTLLLSKEEWFEALQLDKNYRSQKEDYILVYRRSKTPLLKKAVEFVVNQVGKKVVIIDQAFKLHTKAYFHIRDAGPIEFIELFANARWVITDSFHGTCFSINFKKPFVAVCPAWYGGNRVESLLNLFGLKDRFINDEKDIYKLNVDLNYDSLEKQLQEERAKSIKVLSSSIVS
ncbi:polysaccharide pyruvyl transferase [Thioploca ingrica]|uniref:Polysaccharide pyruvyl transferase n=1 Tax=Thioploca ingrica TaxID=40754 RepID=A0A090BUZ0_9GAMM|nr:polysaccharide pyruvyl transferase [Thioploca ingrica]